MRAGRRSRGRLQPKLIRAVLLLVSGMFVALFLVQACDVYAGYQRREIESQRSQLNLAAGRISALQQSIENLGKLIVYNDVVQTNIDTRTSRPGLYLYTGRRISQTLKEYQHTVDGIEEITIYAADGRTLTSRYVRGDFDPRADWFQEFMDSGRTSGYSGVHRSVPFQSGYAVDVISYITHYYSIENVNEKLGELIINLNLSQLEAMAHLDDSLLRGSWLLDGSGRALIANGAPEADPGAVLAEMENGVLRRGRGIYVASDSMADGWVLLSEISVPELVRLSMRPILQLLLLFVGMLALASALLSLLIRRIVTPINQLSSAASAVGRGDLSARVDIHTDDEIEELAEAFNRMVVDIDRLIYESVEHEKKLQQMQLENLMLQINPHFIYNTMNSIVYMARMNGNEQIAEYTNAFISLLQSTLRVRSSVFVTLGDELRTVRSYLYLQAIRYGNKFSWEIDCPDELMDCQVLNAMLQPVVENSIFHGIAPKDGPGRIDISAQRAGEQLTLRVTDDGVGIPPEALAEIFREDAGKGYGVHRIGIGNVRKRIQEVYGAEGALEIASEPGRGTRVTMRVPCRREEIDNLDAGEIPQTEAKEQNT